MEGLIDISECDVSILKSPALDFDGDVFVERVGDKVYVRVRR
jgi:hypothetical protein